MKDKVCPYGVKDCQVCNGKYKYDPIGMVVMWNSVILFLVGIPIMFILFGWWGILVFFILEKLMASSGSIIFRGKYDPKLRN